MKSPALRGTARRRTAFIAVLLAPALAACGFGAQTDQIYQAAQGSDSRTTSVKILNAVIVAQEDGSGTFAGSFVNDSNETQTLIGVTGDTVTASTSVETIAIAPQELLNLGVPVESTDSSALLVLSGEGIEIGRNVRLTFEFSGVGKVTLNVLVVSNDPALGREFDGVPLPPATSTETPAEEPLPAEVESEEVTGGQSE